MCSYLNSVNSIHVLLTIGMSPSSVQLHEWFFMFLCLPIWPVFFKKKAFDYGNFKYIQQ